MNIKNPLRLAILSVAILGFASAIVVNILKIINADDYSEVDHLKMSIIPADRGNIYTYDNQLLAVNSLRYELRFDGTYINPNTKELNILALDLSKILKNKSKDAYLADLLKAQDNKYYLLKREISLSQIDKIKKIKFYQKPLHGGIIIQQHTIRKKPNLNSASRTIGDLFKDDNTPIYGLEYSYNSELMGKNGKCLVLHEPGLDRKIDNANNIEPESGLDLITTLELDYQDILEQALLRQLEKYEGDFGTAILMEVNSGRIKAITNLQKTESNKYAETLNFGVTHQIEPGSTFKTASIMAYFEDHHGNINDTIDCKNGEYTFEGASIATIDHEKLGKVSITEVIAHSSNIGIARLIKKYYQNNPEGFINRIYNFGLGEKSKIDLIGIPKPDIKFPGDKSWSGVSLPWISYGYEISLTVLDILTFYNTIANDGYLIHPYLGYAFQSGSDIIKITRDSSKSHRICASSTIDKIKTLLREVVINGTGNSLNDLPFFVSGKTGTSVKNYGVNKNKEYQASFVGFFPSDKPKYSCIVLIDSPNQEKGFYGSQVAIPAFKEIAKNIYVKEGFKWSNNNVTEEIKLTESIFKILHKNNNMKNFESKTHYPSVVGMHLRDAVYLLEKSGYSVIIKGDLGNVKKQYPQGNSEMKKNLAITLFTS